MEEAMKIVLFFLIFIFFIFTNLLAGTINPNTQDSKYVEYGKKFESVVPIQVYLENRPDDADPNFGSAVIIKPKWAITAAHVVKQQKKCFILKNQKKYLIDKVISHKDFNEDNIETNNLIDTKPLMDSAKNFFKRNGLLLNWKEFEKLDQSQKINTLAMIAPITNEEKQKLLESISLKNKVETLESIISFYLHETNFNNQTVQ